MLKKISLKQARLGMYLHSMEGAWVNHPFWKTRFLLEDQKDLDRLHASALEAVCIDTTKGLDVAEPAVEPVSPPRPTVIPPRPSPPPAAPPRLAMEEALAQAEAVCKRGRAQVMSMFAEARMGKAVDAEQCLPLVNDITNSVFRNPGALVNLARLKTLDDYTYMHSVAVCALMVSLGRELGMDEADCRVAGLAGLLHDMGKAAMPLEILNKPGRLTDAEFEIMRTHPRKGYELLSEARGVSAPVLDVALHHHERFDGGGYPDSLQGDVLCRLARMGAVCDVYDAITSNRAYKQAWDPAESIARMASWKGQFDPFVLKAFIRSLGIYPTGSLVRLKSDNLALVVDQNTGDLVSPVVKIIYSLKSQLRVTPRRLDMRHSQDSIVGRELPEKWGFGSLDHLWAGDAAPRK